MARRKVAKMRGLHAVYRYAAPQFEPLFNAVGAASVNF